MRSLTFNNVPSYSLGIAISGEGTYDAPARNVSKYTVPGRNGDLILDNGSYKNITVVYPAFVTGDFQTNDAAIREWLLSPKGYSRLTDDYHPDEYRLAMYSGGITFDPTAWNKHAEFNMRFDCKPQRFLVSGEEQVTIASSSDTITNPTGFDALPLIEIDCVGDAVVTVNGTTMTFEGLEGGIVLDCDIQTAYYGLDPMGGYMMGAFPFLGPGENAISYRGDVTEIRITPRWWRL